VNRRNLLQSFFTMMGGATLPAKAEYCPIIKYNSHLRFHCQLRKLPDGPWDEDTLPMGRYELPLHKTADVFNPHTNKWESDVRHQMSLCIYDASGDISEGIVEGYRRKFDGARVMKMWLSA
jgi:hypothetical protein